MTEEQEYTFVKGQRAMHLIGYTDEEAFYTADQSVRFSPNGYWKASVELNNYYTWTKIERTIIPCN